MAMAGEYLLSGNVHLQWLPHPPPVDPHCCTLLTKVSPLGHLCPGCLLSGLGSGGGGLVNLGIWD